MPNGRKRLSAAFASSILLAASMLVATAAPAQTSGGDDNYYGCIDPNSGSAGGGYGYGNGYGYGPGYGCCQYDVYSGGWYIMYASHWEPCPPPPYQSPDQPTDSASQAPTELAE